jgi:hypothetical protein
MKYKKIEGFKPKIFVPEESANHNKKYNCKDCFSCQWCSDDRCRRCLGSKGCKEDNRFCTTGDNDEK